LNERKRSFGTNLRDEVVVIEPVEILRGMALAKEDLYAKTRE
jgi:hypothetical protein